MKLKVRKTLDTTQALRLGSALSSWTFEYSLCFSGNSPRGSGSEMLAQGFLELSEIPVFGALSVSLARSAVAACLPNAVDISLRREIFFRECLTARAAPLPPPALAVLPVTLMAALMLWPGQGLQIHWIVVGPVLVDVMDMPAFGDGAMMPLVYQSVLADDRAIGLLEEPIARRTEPARLCVLSHAREVVPGRPVHSFELSKISKILT